ncbi:DSP4 [Symbiodinium pilosum]|uniref:DSP4 protein n=1 Tax=Symbiodinium pilosum TaxID=2952 RepID=A0A812N2R2_SYMPI|nr:DSP4 [Symbiodinium pilosum]
MAQAAAGDGATSAKYSETMQKQMGSSLVYKHEDGMNYAKCFERIYIGSCLQTAADVDTLKKEGVGIVFCLQEDKDMAHFNIDLAPILARAKEVDILHVRHPIKDFDPLSLRKHLPDAVRRLNAEMLARPKDAAYIHCTAGLGRAPATALAYMFMIEGMDLDDAYAHLYKSRRCHPQLNMVRAAACDLLGGGLGSGKLKLSWTLPEAKCVEVAGLDIGWHERVPMVKNATTGEFVLERDTPPGVYQYKFIVDGKWMANPDLPSVTDNGNVNNVARVNPAPGSADSERRERMMKKGGRPTEEEWKQLQSMLAVPAAPESSQKSGYAG